MRTFLRGKVPLLVLAIAVVLAVPVIAFADAVRIDGDVLNQGNSKNTKFCLTPGDPGSVNQAVTIDYNGNQHFASGANVTITPSVETAGQNFITATGGSVTTANWDDTQDKVTTGNLPLTVGTNWVAGTYKVTYTATGAKAGGGTLTIDSFSNIIISDATNGCDDGGGTTTNNAPVVNVTGIDAANYEINDEPTPGCSVVDPEDGSAATASPVVDRSGLNAYGLGPVTVTCSYTDTSGESGTDQVTYNIVDTGAPVITHVSDSPASPNGSHQWYTSPVTTTFRAEDFNGASPAGAGAGFADHTNPYNFTVSSGAAEGNNVPIDSGTVFDVASNESNSVSSGPFKIDLSDPSLGNIVDNNAASSNYCTGSAPVKPTGFAPSDSVSGIDTDPAKTYETWTPPLNNVFGTYSYEAKATDFAGRTDTFAKKTYSYTYGIGQTGGASYSGVLQPVNQDGSSRFKLGSTVPVKFTFTCGGTPITTAVPKLTVKQGDTKPDPGVDEAISTAASTTGNAFRLVDASTGMYLFNLSTKSGYLNPGETQPTAFSQGTWTLGINFGDNTSQTVKVQLVR